MKSSARKLASLLTLVFASMAACSSEDEVRPQDLPDSGAADSGAAADVAPSSVDSTASGPDVTDERDGSPADADDTRMDTGANDGGRIEAGTVDTGTMDAGTPAVRFRGRMDTSDPARPKASWPATGAVVRFSGTELRAELGHTDGFAGGPTYLEVIVDGVAKPTPLKVDGTQMQVVASGLSAGVHEVEILKRTSPNQGVVQFGSFQVGAGMQLPSIPQSRRIEVLGNSSIDGFGMDGAGPNCPGGNKPEYSNAAQSVTVLTAQKLSADYSLLGYAGKGITRNYAANDMQTFPLLFGRTLAESSTVTWNFTNAPVDAFVLIMPNLDAESTDNVILSGYRSFLTQIRAAYPSARILLVVSSTATDFYPPGLQTRTRLRTLASTLVAERAQSGDVKFSAHEMQEYTEAQLSGCDYHPNRGLHQQMANELAGWLKQSLGW
jgi:Carbohydrate esterase 2 N-terminal